MINLDILEMKLLSLLSFERLGLFMVILFYGKSMLKKELNDLVRILLSILLFREKYGKLPLNLYNNFL
jgi:hypothetical protein